MMFGLNFKLFNLAYFDEILKLLKKRVHLRILVFIWLVGLVKNDKPRKISCKSLLHCGRLMKELPELKYLYYSEKATRVSFN